MSKKHINLIQNHIYDNINGMCNEANENIKYPFLDPGCNAYAGVLWDWDSWFTNIALRQALENLNDNNRSPNFKKYERGCILNFLTCCGTGYIPYYLDKSEGMVWPEDIRNTNMHKPCLAQHAAFLVKEDNDAEWLRDYIHNLAGFIDFYYHHHKHQCGLYYWQNDNVIGVDDDPCSYGRPPKSSGSIYLNTLMYKELLAMVYLCDKLNLSEIGEQYQKNADDLKNAIQEYCWDERDGFYFSVDLNIHRQKLTNRWGRNWGLHCGAPCNWACLIQRIDVWSGFMGLWSGIATQEQAEMVVQGHYKNERTFNTPYGIRTLSKLEKMYNLKPQGNPSTWLGPIWGISNYIVFKGLIKYGYNKEAQELAEKTILLFGRDIERCGAMHEYYIPESGEPIINKGFKNWNFLVLNMIAFLENKKVISEF